MDILGKYIDELRELFVKEADAQADLKKLQDVYRAALADAWRSENKPPAQLDEYDKVLSERCKERREALRTKMMDFLHMPPHYARHFDKLSTFHGDRSSSFETAVFIMTKFPVGKTALDRQLHKVIETVEDAVRTCGFVPRIAMNVQYHPILWDNVELHLVGCSRGIAIVEDVYKKELNPNVAMEWGCMKAMGKDVLFLAEQEFAHRRADLTGLIEHPFDWKRPAAGINKAVSNWLLKQ